MSGINKPVNVHVKVYKFAILNSIDSDRHVHMQSDQDKDCSHITYTSLFKGLFNLCRLIRQAGGH